MNSKSKKGLLEKTFLAPLYFSLLGSLYVLITRVYDVINAEPISKPLDMVAFYTFMSFVMLLIVSYAIYILLSILLCFILPRVKSSIRESIVRTATNLRLTVFSIVVFVLVSWVQSYQSSYARYLPSTATNVKIDKVGHGIDWAIYMRADVDEDGFREFVSRLKLSPVHGSDHNFNTAEVSVRDWWQPKERNPHYKRYLYYEDQPETVSDLLWTTYEDGTLFFTRQNY